MQFVFRLLNLVTFCIHAAQEIVLKLSLVNIIYYFYLLALNLISNFFFIKLRRYITRLTQTRIELFQYSTFLEHLAAISMLVVLNDSLPQRTRQLPIDRVFFDFSQLKACTNDHSIQTYIYIQTVPPCKKLSASYII